MADRRVIRGRSHGPAALYDVYRPDSDRLVRISVANLDDVAQLPRGATVELRVIERRADVLSEIGVHLDDLGCTDDRDEAIADLEENRFGFLAGLVRRYWEAEE